jgi:hypothetical protein
MHVDTGSFTDDTAAVDVGRNRDPKETNPGTQEFTGWREVEKGR